MRVNKKNSQGQEEAGFTLIELLLAFFILSMIMSVLFGAVSGIARSKEALDDGRDGQAIVDSLVLRLSRELQLATPGVSLLPPKGDNTTRYPANINLIGEEGRLNSDVPASSIRFIANGGGQYISDGSGNTGLVQIGYRLEKNPDLAKDPDAEFYLVRDEVPVIRPYEKAYERQITFPIAKNVVGLEFRYFSTAERTWSSTWGENNHTGLPRIVEFSITVRSPKGRTETFKTAVPLQALAQ